MKIKKGVILQQLGEEHVAFDNETSTLHEVNEQAFKILKNIKEGKNKKEILNLIVKEHKVDKSQARKDLGEFLENLKNKDLIVVK